MITFVSGRSESFGVPIAGIWRWIEWAVCQDHGVINQKRLGLVLIDEVADKIGTELWSILAIDIVFFFAVEFQHWIDEPAIERLAVLLGSPPTSMLPEAGLFKPEVLRRVLLLSQLPLAGDAGCISSSLQLVRKGCLASIKEAKFDVVAHVVLPRHDFCP